jgi:type I restriction enzyme S subunit
LRQSILKSAFSGQLTPQDPTDEPASVLLERITVERNQQKTKAAPKTARRKKVTA